jgi:hypothetical protein
MWDRALNVLGEKVCALYPFICELCYKVDHFKFQCSVYDNSLSNPMSTTSLYCDDTITPNQHDELTIFLGCEELSRKTSLVDMSAFDMDSFLQGFHLYCTDNCHTNTYIKNVIKDEALPKYGRTNMFFVLINEKEESSKVSSIVCDKKPGYVEKPPFKPLPLKEKKKKKKIRSKRREETISSPKHVAPIIVFDESEIDDVPMPVTYSSDHDWEKHSTFDTENLFGTNSENDDVNNCCTISVIHVPSNYDIFTNEHTLEDIYSIAYDDYNKEYDIFSPPTIEEKTRYDYNMPPIFYDYGDENDYVYVGSINPCMHVAHDKNVLCDSYIVNSIHDATKSYYERGKHDFMHVNNIRFPLFMLKFLKLHLFCLPILVALCFYDLFIYETLFLRKWFRFKFVLYLIFDALSCFKLFCGAYASIF